MIGVPGILSPSEKENREKEMADVSESRTSGLRETFSGSKQLQIVVLTGIGLYPSRQVGTQQSRRPFVGMKNGG
jgi:hypothetical protein